MILELLTKAPLEVIGLISAVAAIYLIWKIK